MTRDSVADAADAAGLSRAETAAEPFDQSGDRAAYLAEMARLLWPAPARVSLSGAEGDITAGEPAAGGSGQDAAQAAPATAQAASDFIVLPVARRPRLLVPTGRRPAAAAVRRYGEPGSLRAQLAIRGLSLVLGSGIGGALLRDRLRVRIPAGSPTIESYLRATLDADVRVSMHLGAARANRKPVLQLLTPAGHTVGFAKIGVNSLTSSLIQAERQALTRLGQASVTSVTVPSVLHYGSWQDLMVLVLSPLPVWKRRTTLRPGQLSLAMAEVAAVAGTASGPLAGSGYWRALGERLAAADDTADKHALLRALDMVAGRAGDTVLSFGAWHGDWTAWNMASTRHGLLVWDWERFTGNVPLGFDALHYWLQTQLHSGRRDPRLAAAECIEQAPALLAPLGTEGDQARLTALAYLADLSIRYLADRQAEAGQPLGAPGWWLIPALTATAAQL